MSQLEIYVHRAGEREMRKLDSATQVRELLDNQTDAQAWLEDSEEPLDPERSLAQAGVGDRVHVHVSRCRRVSVRVRYGGDERTRDFSPANTVDRVFNWVTGPQGFNLTPAEKAKHTLGLCAQPTQPDRADHVGTYADACKACFDLAPKERFEG